MLTLEEAAAVCCVSTQDASAQQGRKFSQRPACLRGLQADVSRLTAQLAGRDAELAVANELRQRAAPPVEQLQALAAAAEAAHRHAETADAEASDVRYSLAERDAQLSALEGRLAETEAALTACQVRK